jgi:putative PEP-CTERM system histidine kinase
VALTGLTGYIFASLAYFVFILLLLAARNRTTSGLLVLLGSCAMLLALIAGALQLERQYSLRIVFIFENLKLLFWPLLVVATRDNIQSFHQLITSSRAKNYIAIWSGLTLACWLIDFYGDANSKYLFTLFLVLNLWTLVMLEQLYRNADVKSKWALWPLIIALGAIFVFDFVMFAQASMLAQLDFNFWYLRSFVAIAAVPFLLISTRRMKNWSVNVFISRDVVFYSSMLMISGMYLLIMAFAGYVINYLGGHWGNMLSLAFLVMGTVVLAALLMTEKLRREVKVFITKHFFANKYDYRVEWQKLIEQLETSEDNDYYQTALNIMRGSMEISYGAIIKKKPSGRFEALYTDEIEINQALFTQLQLVDQYCANKPWIVDIREYNSIENSYAELFIDSDIFVDAGVSIIVPIISSEQHYGFFLLSSPSDEKRLLNWEDRDLLTAIAKQLNHYLALNEANDKLAYAKQFDAFNRMSAFLVHDLKNVQAQLALISANAERHRDNPAFIDDVFETVTSATQRLDKTLSQLRNKTVIEAQQANVNLNRLIEQVVAQRNVDLPKVSVEFEQEINMVIDKDTLFSVLNHLLQNAQEATSDDGWVNIKVSYFEHSLNLAISDNGKGMSEHFIKHRLFKPFDTTKGNAGMGIGVFEAKQFIEGLGGSIQVTSFEHKGTSFVLNIPDNQR